MTHRAIQVSTLPINTGSPFSDFSKAVSSELGLFQYGVPYSIGNAFVVFCEQNGGSILIFRKVNGSKTGVYWCDRVTKSGNRRRHLSYLRFEAQNNFRSANS